MRSILTTLLCGALLITVPSPRQSPFAGSSRIPKAITERIVVLTFDDAVKSHRTLVAPLLKQLGFGATFFVTHRWMDDAEHFLTWEEIAEIYEMGFEIGNHSWTHANFSVPKNAARLAAELTLVENELHKLGVPRPVSFAYSGNAFGPEAVEQLTRTGYKFARRGTQPEADYRNLELGPLFDPRKHHRLLIPTTGNAQPNWTPEQFQRIVNQAQEGRIVVLQFHGVPDVKHPWVHTPPVLFRQYMDYLKQPGFRVIALRDLQQFLPDSSAPADPMTETRYPADKNQSLALPSEMVSTRGDLANWLESMLHYHRYNWEETAEVIGYPADQVKRLREGQLNASLLSGNGAKGVIQVLPYPGGRHPRIGFQEGAILPHRGPRPVSFCHGTVPVMSSSISQKPSSVTAISSIWLTPIHRRFGTPATSGSKTLTGLAGRLEI